MCMRARESAYPVAVRLPCRCSLLPLGSMLSHHLNASLKSYHLLQTLMIEHASHLCVRSSHQAIHYASALVSVVASAASCFFVIGNRSKKSLSENPTELGGARRLWAPTCKHWMVSAATLAFPYQSLATSFADSTHITSVRSIFTSCYPLHLFSGFCCCFCCFMLFFSSETGARTLSLRIPQNWAEPEDCGR